MASSAAQRLLELTVEYQESVRARTLHGWPGEAEGSPTGREPAVIVDEYEATLRRFVASPG